VTTTILTSHPPGLGGHGHGLARFAAREQSSLLTFLPLNPRGCIADRYTPKVWRELL